MLMGCGVFLDGGWGMGDGGWRMEEGWLGMLGVGGVGIGDWRVRGSGIYMLTREKEGWGRSRGAI